MVNVPLNATICYTFIQMLFSASSHSQTDRSQKTPYGIAVFMANERVSFIYSIKSLSASPKALSISSTSKVNNALSCWSFSCASVRSLMVFCTSWKQTEIDDILTEPHSRSCHILVVLERHTQ